MDQSYPIPLDPHQKLLEAGVMLVNQAGMSLIDAAYSFPEQSNGKITQDGSGVLEVRGPFNEKLRISMDGQQNDRQINNSVHTDIYDSLNNKLSSKEEQNDATIVEIIKNQYKNHCELRRADGSLQVQMDGISFIEPVGGSARDISGIFTDEKGNYLGEMNLVARENADNVLNVTALYMFHQTYLGNVELLLAPDSQGNADIQISKKWEPPPPPAPKVTPEEPGTAGGEE